VDAAAERHAARVSKVAEICALLERGSSRSAAAKQCGVGWSKLSHWRRDHDDIRTMIDAAEARAECTFSDRLSRLSENGSLGATTFWLERRRRKTWGKDRPEPIEAAAEDTDEAALKARWKELTGRDWEC
jgi:hypothetical protein